MPRKQAGFPQEITFLYLNGREVEAFSLWETAEHAEAYNWATYPEVMRMLASVIEGALRVLSSTLRMYTRKRQPHGGVEAIFDQAEAVYSESPLRRTDYFTVRVRLVARVTVVDPDVTVPVTVME